MGLLDGFHGMVADFSPETMSQEANIPLYDESPKSQSVSLPYSIGHTEPVLLQAGRDYVRLCVLGDWTLGKHFRG